MHLSLLLHCELLSSSKERLCRPCPSREVVGLTSTLPRYSTEQSLPTTPTEKNDFINQFYTVFSSKTDKLPHLKLDELKKAAIGENMNQFRARLKHAKTHAECQEILLEL